MSDACFANVARVCDRVAGLISYSFDIQSRIDKRPDEWCFRMGALSVS